MLCKWVNRVSIEQAELLLQKFYGYATFRPGQRKIIQSILAGHNTMGIMPTGGGKSICYQIPALMFPGITIVISPLISLMKDQVDGLKQLGISATYINSTLQPHEIDQRIEALRSGEVKLLYIAPERLESERFQTIFETLPIYLVTIDEAHCISTWGHDFRPSYRSMAERLLTLPRRPLIAALTATATVDVRDDIANLLQISPKHIFSTKLERDNLSFYVHRDGQKREFITQYLRDHPGQTGILYCSTRKEVDQLHRYLKEEGFPVAKYHAGMSDLERNRAQEAFSYDRIQTIIATNAFGMGIDKSNVRFVIHYNLPRNLECYYQEAGRAGRDGDRSECILLFSPTDIQTQKYLIDHSEMTPERKTLELSKLRCMVDYCFTDECYQQAFIRYFGSDHPYTCGTCGNCRKKLGEAEDRTIDAQKIFSCIKRMNEHFGFTVVSKVLRGSKNKRILSWGLDRLSTYGIMKDQTEKEIIQLCHQLVSNHYLTLDLSHPSVPVAKLTPLAIDVLKGSRRVLLHREETRTPTVEPSRGSLLFEELKALRKSISEREQLPPYIIFQDSTLKEMCRRLPITEQEMRAIPGVGELKYAKHGHAFLALIQKYVDKHGRRRTASAPEQSEKEQSHLLTYRLFQEGKTIDEIAKLRQLTRGTIEDHLIRAGLDGHPLDWDAFIPARWEALIMRKIDELGAHKLRPLKDALPDEVDYMAIKAAILKKELAELQTQ
ncbi:RecQ-like ATP-dependent DNA helicase [Laceyella sediminis]|uniref:DNA helicase RecQ n=1 Tax=Laceyella sediminis TaxID=573074 RepID=A0ABX5EQ09_9BACL|nr:RecQ-like ATP-dependent DNA helicase [Laceyella sediminis]